MIRRQCLAAALALTLLTPAFARQEEEPPATNKKEEPDLSARLKKVKGSFSLIVSIRVKKGEEKTLIEAAKPAIAATVGEKGCKRYELHQDLETPTKFVLVERWDSVADLEAHMASAHTKKLLETLGKIADGPPKIEIAKRRAQPKK